MQQLHQIFYQKPLLRLKIRANLLPEIEHTKNKTHIVVKYVYIIIHFLLRSESKNENDYIDNLCQMYLLKKC